MKIIFTSAVSDYFDKLETILYEKGYFSYPESSHLYIEKLVRKIHADLPTKLHKSSTTRFDRLDNGMLYAAFRHNRNTTWYVFFTRHTSADGETVFIVRYITNNHAEGQYL